MAASVPSFCTDWLIFAALTGLSVLRPALLYMSHSPSVALEIAERLDSRNYPTAHRLSENTYRNTWILAELLHVSLFIHLLYMAQYICCFLLSIQWHWCSTAFDDLNFALDNKQWTSAVPLLFIVQIKNGTYKIINMSDIGWMFLCECFMVYKRTACLCWPNFSLLELPCY